MSQDEWFSVWMLGKIRKRKRMEGFEYLAMRTVVKEDEDEFFDRFMKIFKEIKVEGIRKSVTGINYTKSESESKNLHDTKYNDVQMETMYIGTESEARKQFQRARDIWKKVIL